jgi:hypothetical protein
MIVNKFLIKKPNIDDLVVNLPIVFDWDLLDQQDSINQYENDVINHITDNKIDYELSRFSPKKCSEVIPGLGLLGATNINNTIIEDKSAVAGTLFIYIPNI